eukprot:PhM_4_TR16605/c0_g3_i1/m.5471/K08516/YKT6; synaptobrevin homolog YKT6
MKLFSIMIFRCKVGHDEEPTICSSSIDVSSFNMFQRSSVREFIQFLSRTVAKGIASNPGTAHQVTKEDYVLYGYSRSDGIIAVAATDNEYNPRVATSMLFTTVSDFAERFRAQWEAPEKPKDGYVSKFNGELDAVLAKFQDPSEADKILKIQKELDETKLIMHQAIDSLLERGAKIDDLVEKSSELGTASKAFYKTAKSQNQCCIIS